MMQAAYIYDDVPFRAPQFTGKERDSETGLDYFGARYYASTMGRFTSVDPSSVSIDRTDPQSWNRYNYSLNNPLRFVDPNGKWPTDIHDNIIAKAFPGLSPQQRQVLMNASYNTDFKNKVNGKSPQDPSNSFIHAMSNGTTNPQQTVTEAELASENFVNGNLATAKTEQATFQQNGRSGLSDNALTSFGNAGHTIMDGFSPKHEGYQPWNGTGTVGDAIGAVAHAAGELSISPETMNAVVGALREQFKTTFGEQALQQAITPPPQPKVPDEPKRRGSIQ